MASIPEEPARFEYEPLEPGYIRILQLQPGNRTDPLRGELIVAPIDTISIQSYIEKATQFEDETVSSKDEEEIAYDALSYMWGDPKPVDVIYLSGKSLPIAANLATALHHLRYEQENLTIWIDAVCINQPDFAERAEQVPLMRHIYSRADTVRIWINEPDIDGTSEAVSALKVFDKASDDELRHLGPDPSFWDPVAPIFANPYWNRVWVQQEVLNARQLSLHCTNIVIPGTSLAQFQEAINEWQNLSLILGDELGREWGEHLRPFVAHRGAPAANNIKEYTNGQKFWDLYPILYWGSKLGMMDGRDRVYALMHLAKDYEDGGIKVDYSKTELDVLIDAATYHVSRHENIDFLHKSMLVGTDRSFLEQYHDEHIPTWLPPRWLRRITRGQAVDYLKTEMMKTRCSPTLICVKTRRVKVRGVKVDTVRRSLTSVIDWNTMTVRQFWDSLLGLYLRIFGGVGMKNLPQEVYRTLVPERLTTTRTSYNTCVSGLSSFIRLCQDRQYVDMKIGFVGRRIRQLFGSAEYLAVQYFLEMLANRIVIMTEGRYLGVIPKCDIAEGDEIWIVLGCSLPIILRPQDNGTYWHVCTAYIPKLLDNPAIRGLSSDVQPGDQVGEWTVTDIELE